VERGTVGDCFARASGIGHHAPGTNPTLSRASPTIRASALTGTRLYRHRRLRP